VEHDLTSRVGRIAHFFKVTNPMNSFHKASTIDSYSKEIKEIEKKAKDRR